MLVYIKINFLPSLTNQIYLSTNKDVKDETINLSDTSLEFKGKSDGKDYALNIEFFKAVDSEGSKYNVMKRSVQMMVMKGKAKKDGDAKEEEDDDTDEEFWPRLLKDKALEKNQVRISLIGKRHIFYVIGSSF